MCSWLIMHRGQRPSALFNQEYMIVSVLFCLNHDKWGFIVQTFVSFVCL